MLPELRTCCFATVQRKGLVLLADGNSLFGILVGMTWMIGQEPTSSERWQGHPTDSRSPLEQVQNAAHPIPTDDRPPSPPAPVPASSVPLKVINFEIKYYDGSDKAVPLRGRIDAQCSTGRQGDAVTLHAEFSRPAYAYLVALAPMARSSCAGPITTRPLHQPARRPASRARVT